MELVHARRKSLPTVSELILWILEKKKMEKEECKKEYENHGLVMSEEKCNKCPYLYECCFMFEVMQEVVYGGI